MLWVRVSSSEEVRTFARPKSVILGQSSSTEGNEEGRLRLTLGLGSERRTGFDKVGDEVSDKVCDNKIFEGLRSRWRMPREWAYAIMSASWRMRFAARRAGNG